MEVFHQPKVLTLDELIRQIKKFYLMIKVSGLNFYQIWVPDYLEMKLIDSNEQRKSIKRYQSSRFHLSKVQLLRNGSYGKRQKSRQDPIFQDIFIALLFIKFIERTRCSEMKCSMSEVKIKMSIQTLWAI